MNVLLWMSGSFDRRTPSEHLLSAIIAALQGQGHTVHVLQKDTGGEKLPLPEEADLPGVTTTRIKCKLANKSNLIARYITDILYVVHCRRWLKAHRNYDRVFLQSSNVAGFQVFVVRNLLKNVPVTYNVQDIFPENAGYTGKLRKNSLPYRVLSAVQWYAYQKADQIITLSEDMKRQLTEIGVDSDKINVVYNWSYRDTVYAPEEVDDHKVAALFNADRFNVVYAGNIGVVQNVELLVRAAAQMKDREDIAFHIIGEGGYRNKLEQLAGELGADNLRFHDMLPSASAPAIYLSADINVIPLAENIYRTALPSKTATCLACGKPIIFAMGTESEFGRKMMEQTGCPLVDSDDVSGLCNAILKIKNGEIKCETGKVFLRDFSKTANSRKYVCIVEDTAQTK